LKKSSHSHGIRLRELAAAVGGMIDGDDQIVITGVAPIETAGPGEVSFVANKKYLQFIETTRCSALILEPSVSCERVPVLRHENPYLAFARVVALLYPALPLVEPGIDNSAVVHPDSQIDATARIGPLCHVSKGSRIGKNCRLVSSVFIGEDARIGENCLLYPRVCIMYGSRIGGNVVLHPGVVVGSDGFGFAESDAGHEKIKQVGWVEIADDVEIGANTTIDRGTIGPTRIGRGSKIDNLVQIAHNVEIGEDCIIVSQVGISGSTKLGDRVILAGQVGLVGHIDIGDDVRIGAQSGVSKSVAAGKTMFGYPAREVMETKRIEACLPRLPDLLKRVKELEKKLFENSGD
jgi:UDP-3-O-[3-hydroxymyristoyl] glucosamine N-acyltransferase